MPIRFLLMGLLAALLAGPAAQAAPAPPKKYKILYVLRLGWRDQPTDERIKHHLDSLGYSVTLADQAAPATTAKGYDLVMISSTISSRDFPATYRDVAVPVLTWENDILDDMRFTGKRKDVDFGEVEKEHYLWLVNAPHPLGAGVPAGMAFAYNRDQPMGWGKPGLGATIIATLPGQPERATVFAYEKGATMDYDFLAPARRVMLFLDNGTFPQLNATGLTLFDAAVRWAVGQP